MGKHDEYSKMLRAVADAGWTLRRVKNSGGWIARSHDGQTITIAPSGDNRAMENMRQRLRRMGLDI